MVLVQNATALESLALTINAQPCARLTVALSYAAMGMTRLRNLRLTCHAPLVLPAALGRMTSLEELCIYEGGQRPCTQQGRLSCRGEHWHCPPSNGLQRHEDPLSRPPRHLYAHLTPACSPCSFHGLLCRLPAGGAWGRH